MTTHQLKQRFRGFLPVVVDVETAGFDCTTDALLEVAAVFLEQDEETGMLSHTKHYHAHLKPFDGANIEQSALDFLGLDLDHPFRLAKEEKIAIPELCARVKEEVKKNGCTRAVLVGHNPMFDLGFLQVAFERNNIKSVPFHKFTTFDTATLSAACFGQTVLSRAMFSANIEFDTELAHGALYDAQKTAELFCKIINETTWCA